MHGVPNGVKLEPRFYTEIMRLYELCKAGKFDWRTTPTTIGWLIKEQVKARGEQLSTAIVALGRVDEDEDEEPWGFEEMAAEGVVEPTQAYLATTAVHSPSAYPSTEEASEWMSEVYNERVLGGYSAMNPFGVEARRVQLGVRNSAEAAENARLDAVYEAQLAVDDARRVAESAEDALYYTPERCAAVEAERTAEWQAKAEAVAAACEAEAAAARECSG
jgi:hypothetical protein